MKKIGTIITFTVLIRLSFSTSFAQNIDGDGMSLNVDADTTLRKCEGLANITMTTCLYFPQQLIVDNIFNPVNISYPAPFEIHIELFYCKLGTSINNPCHDTTFSFSNLQSGNYKIVVTSHVQTCIGGFSTYDMDSTFILIDQQQQSLFNPFPPSITLCENDPSIDYITLDAGTGYSQYSWNTGASGQFLRVEQEGVYSVYVKDAQGCFYQDNLFIGDDCPPSIYIPNSFTPNNDGVNDSFKIHGEDIILNEMQIFNRWGKLIFETNEINQGWKGEGVKSGIYVYKVNYATSEKRRNEQIGRVTLIR